MNLGDARSSGNLLADRRFAYAERALEDGDATAAGDVARQALELAPRWVPAWLLLGTAEERLGRLDAARAAYDRAAGHDTDGRFGAALHVARLSGEAPPDAMPDAYVATLFDQYAARFDRHLVDGLGYRGPALLASALARVCGARRFARALDLGCGTGLMGVAVRDRVDRLDGVDLSPAMVRAAEGKAVYDALHVGEIVRHLRTAPSGAFDLILAADVLVYVGRLDPVFEAAEHALVPGGLLAFTTQTHPDEGLHIGDDLRYAHPPTGVRHGLERAGLAVTLLEHASTRREKGSDVPGLVAVAQKRLVRTVLDKVSHPAVLPPVFLDWFERRGWAPRAHQLALLAEAEAGRSALLIAPTGAGKTLAGFLPSLVELSSRPRLRTSSLHTLYVSPLKALSVDVARNVEVPVADMGLPIRVETRTGDTGAGKRQRQRRDPPDILLTTPEQVALLLASPSAKELFKDLRRIVLDELHALVTSKRGDLLALGLARLRRLAPDVQVVGLSATVREPDELRRFISPGKDDTALVVAPEGAKAELTMLDTRERLPWAGHGARHAIGEIYAAIRQAKMSLLFVNTRFQAEQLFNDLWRVNTETLPIALHHGSLDVNQRRRVEAAMADGSIKAVVCTSTLDLGIDWGDVDLVVNVGAPKGASRLIQRIGRANHRLDEPSRALLIPANRLEVLECRAAIEAAAAGVQDTPAPRTGALDVLAQHILGMACAEPFGADALYAEVRDAAPYADLPRRDFDDAVEFVAHGGYALRAYDRFAKIREGKDGTWRVSNGRVAQTYRMNVGTIVQASMLKVRLVRGKGGAEAGSKAMGPVGRGGRVLGDIEEGFLETLLPGDTFLFGGEVLALHAIVENEAQVVRTTSDAPKVPSYAGSKFPLTDYLASHVRELLSNPEHWSALPAQVSDWLDLQRRRSALPPPGSLLVETFPRGGRSYLMAYPFEGRLAHQTLGMLLTRRMERAGLKPMGFVANDYAIAVWSAVDLGARIRGGLVSLDDLFAQDMLGDDLEDWLLESSLMKRTFRTCAIIAGLIERNHPGRQNTGRQMTVSTDLVYDVLRRHEPDHVLLRAARADAATGLLDLARFAHLLSRIEGRIIHKDLRRISPLAVPIMLEIGREPVYGEAQDHVLAEAADILVEEAFAEDGDAAAEPTLVRPLPGTTARPRGWRGT